VCYLQSDNYTFTDLEIFSYINSFCRILPDIRFIFKCKYFVIQEKIVDTYMYWPTWMTLWMTHELQFDFRQGTLEFFCLPRLWGPHSASSLTGTGSSFLGGAVTWEGI